jgi:hypothetical protein
MNREPATKLSLEQAAWLFPLATTAHNLEEGIWLPAWSAHAGHFRWAVGAAEFRFAVVILTVLAYFLTLMAVRRGGRWLDVLACYWLAMLANVVFPHLLATILTRGYAPGIVTAVLLNLPVDSYLLRRAFREQRIQPRRLLLTAALFIPSMALAILLLFKLGRILFCAPCA